MKIWLTLSNNFLMHMEKLLFMDIAQKNHMARIEQTHKLIIHSSMMNPDEEYDEYQHSDEAHSNILMFILKNTTTF